MRNAHKYRCLRLIKRNYRWKLFFLVVFFFIAALPRLAFWKMGNSWSEFASLAVRNSPVEILVLLAVCYGMIVIFYRRYNPERTSLGKVIKKQREIADAPYEDILDLFDAIDRDMEESGMEFKGIMVGKEWIIGYTGFMNATAVLRENIRGVFCLEEIKRNSTVLQILLMTKDTACSCFLPTSRGEWIAAYNFLCGEYPRAINGDDQDYIAFLGQTEEEIDKYFREYERPLEVLQSAPLLQEENFVIEEKIHIEINVDGKFNVK